MRRDSKRLMIVLVGESLVDLLVDPDGSVAARPGGAAWCGLRGRLREEAFR